MIQFSYVSLSGWIPGFQTGKYWVVLVIVVVAVVDDGDVVVVVVVVL